MAFNLSLTRKSDAQPVLAPVWHPNFRNFERLPDTKVVRTTFFINMAAVVLAVSLMLWLGYREFHIRNLAELAAGSQKEIDANTKQSNEAIRLTKVFDDEQKKIADAMAFAVNPISPTDVVTFLARTLPAEISLESLDLKLGTQPPAQCTLRGIVAGSADQATGVVSTYTDFLRSQPEVSGTFETITLNSLDRDAARGVMVFEIQLKAKTAKKEK
ncbi:MAG TPA: hypothetical protein VHD61_03180 [Lacunisphaera sp.]|nr:hypothetical protein [Lacunisphaera sp.]